VGEDGRGNGGGLPRSSKRVTTTILLISQDRAHDLRYSLPAALAQPGAEVIVIDNASSDDTGALAKQHGAEHLRLGERVSWAAANNAGIAAAQGDAVLLLNADCFLEPGFLAAARPHLDEPGIGMVAPKLIRTEGGQVDDRLDAIDCVGMVVDRRRKNNLAGHGRPSLACDTTSASFGPDGAAALYRRDLLDDVAIDGKPLDETFEKWAVDVDLAWRAQILGWRGVYEPSAVAYHVRSYSPSTRAGMPERDRRIQFRNRYLMMVKNDTAHDLRGDLLSVAAYEVAALGYALLRERHLLRGYGELRHLLPTARRHRLEIQARRRLRGSPRAPFGLEPQP
jgi:GT2 family glycosyltransferase